MFCEWCSPHIFQYILQSLCLGTHGILRPVFPSPDFWLGGMLTWSAVCPPGPKLLARVLVWDTKHLPVQVLSVYTVPQVQSSSIPCHTSVLRVLPSHIYPTRYQTCMEIPRLAPPAWCAPHQCHPVLGQLPAPRGPHEPACAGGSQLLMPASLFLKYLFLFFEKKNTVKHIYREIFHPLIYSPDVYHSWAS